MGLDNAPGQREHDWLNQSAARIEVLGDVHNGSPRWFNGFIASILQPGNNMIQNLLQALLDCFPVGMTFDVWLTRLFIGEIDTGQVAQQTQAGSPI